MIPSKNKISVKGDTCVLLGVKWLMQKETIYKNLCFNLFAQFYRPAKTVNHLFFNPPVHFTEILPPSGGF